MTEGEFTRSPRRDVEEPLYLDSARPRAASSRPAPDVSPAADRPLQLDYAHEPRRRRRGVPLILACALTFVLGVGAGVLYLNPPAVLRDTVSKVLASHRTGEAKTVAQAAPTGPAPSPDQAATTPVSQVEPAPAPEGPLAPSDIQDLPPPPLPPLAEPPATPQAEASKHAPPRHAATPKTAADARPARAHRKAKPLDLDALEKSLQ